MRKAKLFLAITFALSSGLVAQTDMTVLMCVTAADGMAEGEVTIKTRLEELGMVVDAVTAGNTQSDDALNYDLVFVHEAIMNDNAWTLFDRSVRWILGIEANVADKSANAPQLLHL